MLLWSDIARKSGRSAAAVIAIAAVFVALPDTLPPAVAQTVDRRSAPSTTSHPYASHVNDAARRFGIPEAWIWSVMRVESDGNARAVSRAGAMGLMQIMPGTWAQLRARYGLGADPFNVRDNIMAGAAYLREMYDRYGNVSGMLAAYNAGPGRYDEHLGGRPLPTETRAYLARLASITGDAVGAQIAVAMPKDPFAWRQSDLFVRTDGEADTDTSVQIDRDDQGQNNALETALPSDNRAAATPPTAAKSAATDTLFVRRSGAGRPQ